MGEINLRTDIADRYKPFRDVLLQNHQDKLHSVYIVGSALTQDYDPKISDINSVIVLHKMDLKFLELLAPLHLYLRYDRKRHGLHNSKKRKEKRGLDNRKSKRL